MLFFEFPYIGANLFYFKRLIEIVLTIPEPAANANFSPLASYSKACFLTFGYYGPWFVLYKVATTSATIIYDEVTESINCDISFVKRGVFHVILYIIKSIYIFIKM